ncbi:hypothetical protein FBUS_00126 [Fasciolopsis buskii]|uniref:Uncharacterized protein n=1 Tax=Fasciolopsis buskii TaxID=27845 RepID=A0A8E0RS01_9TREM|nr:hypothetical protein FBUS_00126 [Fasciolopsis buski]
MNSPDSITQRAESTFRYTLATSLAYLFLHICALLLLQLPMASHPRSIVAQNYSVLTVSTNLAHSPFTHDCHEHGNGAYSTDAVHVHSHRLSPQFSPTNEAIRMEQCSLDIVSGRISRDSSGFGSSIGHFDGTGTNPSVFSSSFSPGFESPLLTYATQHSSDHCSPSDRVDHHSAPVARLHPVYALNQRPVPLPDTAQVGTLESVNRQNGLICSVPPQLASSELRSPGLVNSFNKMNLRSRCPPNCNNIVCAVDVHNRSVPGLSHPSLEPIPQGQELSVHSRSATLSPDSSSTHHSYRGDAASTESDGGSPVFNGSEKRKSQPCCSCRADGLTDGAMTTRHIDDFNGNPLVDFKPNRMMLSKLKAEKVSPP